MRIFRLLLAKKQLEQKQVADFAMLPQKDARELLYRMLQAGYVSLQVCAALTCEPCMSAVQMGYPIHATAANPRVLPRLSSRHHFQGARNCQVAF